MERHKGVPYKPVLRRKLVGATLAVARCWYHDGFGSIGMGRHKGVPYKPVLRRRLLCRRLCQLADVIGDQIGLLHGHEMRQPG